MRASCVLPESGLRRQPDGGLPDRLREAARQVGRLLPDRRDPERFHIRKNEIAVELGRIARQIERGAA